MQTELLLSVIYLRRRSGWRTNTNMLLSCRWPVASVCRCINTYVERLSPQDSSVNICMGDVGGMLGGNTSKGGQKE